MPLGDIGNKNEENKNSQNVGFWKDKKSQVAAYVNSSATNPDVPIKKTREVQNALQGELPKNTDVTNPTKSNTLDMRSLKKEASNEYNQSADVSRDTSVNDRYASLMQKRYEVAGEQISATIKSGGINISDVADKKMDTTAKNTLLTYNAKHANSQQQADAMNAANEAQVRGYNRTVENKFNDSYDAVEQAQQRGINRTIREENSRLSKLISEKEQELADLNARSNRRYKNTADVTADLDAQKKAVNSQLATLYSERAAISQSADDAYNASKAELNTKIEPKSLMPSSRRDRSLEYRRWTQDDEKQEDYKAAVKEYRQSYETTVKNERLKEAEDYAERFSTKEYGDDYVDLIKSSYYIGRMGQDSSLAWNDYIKNPTAENRAYAEAVDQTLEDFQRRNLDASTPNGWLEKKTQTMANYLPQLADQIKREAPGYLIGAGLGSMVGMPTLGAKIGASLASASYSYETMRGSAFKTLVDIGISEEEALSLANNEAFVSSLIEFGDTFLTLSMTGIDKLAGTVGAKTSTAMLKSAIEGATATTGGKITSTVVKTIVNAFGEYFEEFTQGAVSKASEAKATKLLDGGDNGGNLKPDGTTLAINNANYKSSVYGSSFKPIVDEIKTIFSGGKGRLTADAAKIAGRAVASRDNDKADALISKRDKGEKLSAKEEQYIKDNANWRELNEEGVGGFTIGLVMGGGGNALSTAANYMVNTANAKEIGSSINKNADNLFSVTPKSLVEFGLNADDIGSDAYKLAVKNNKVLKNGGTLSDVAVGKQYIANSKAEISAKLVTERAELKTMLDNSKNQAMSSDQISSIANNDYKMSLLAEATGYNFNEKMDEAKRIKQAEKMIAKVTGTKAGLKADIYSMTGIPKGGTESMKRVWNKVDSISENADAFLGDVKNGELTEEGKARLTAYRSLLQSASNKDVGGLAFAEEKVNKYRKQIDEINKVLFPSLHEETVQNVGFKTEDTTSKSVNYATSNEQAIAQTAGINLDDVSVIKTNEANGNVSYVYSDDFNASTFPTVNKIVTVDRNGKVISTVEPDNQIIYNKSAYVLSDYNGFDVNQQKQAETDWQRRAKENGIFWNNKKLSDKNYFNDIQEKINAAEQSKNNPLRNMVKEAENVRKEYENSSNTAQWQTNLGNARRVAEEAPVRQTENGTAVEQEILRGLVDSWEDNKTWKTWRERSVESVEAHQKSINDIRNRASKLANTSAKEVGLKDGTDAKVKILDENLAQKYNNITNELKSLGAKDVKYVVGSMEFKDMLGTYTVNGLNDNGVIYVQVDNEQFTPEQIAKHEIFHEVLNRNEGLRDRLWAAITNNLGENAVNRLRDDYMSMYEGTGLSEAAIMDEILCDAYGGMDIFDFITDNKGATIATDTVTKESVNERTEQSESVKRETGLDRTTAEGFQQQESKETYRWNADDWRIRRTDISEIKGNVLTKKNKEIFARNNVPVRHTEKLSKSNLIKYERAIVAAKKVDTKYGWCVDAQTVESLAGCKAFLIEDGGAGIAIEPDGNIVGVFKNKGAQSGVLEYMLPLAIAHGGVKMDCFGSFLANAYAGYGFVPVARIGFNEEFKPDGWRPSFGKPDIYFLMHNGDSLEASINGDYKYWTDEDFEALPLFEDTIKDGEVVDGQDAYSKAMQYRDELLDASENIVEYTKENAGQNRMYEVVHALAKVEQSRLNDICRNIAEQLNLPKYVDSESKSIKSIKSKEQRLIAKGADSTVGNFNDLCRTKILCSNLINDLPNILRLLKENGYDYTLKLSQNDWGYKGIHLSLKGGMGIKCEVQISTPELWNTKLKSDEIYDGFRDVDIKKLSPDSKEYKEFYKAVKKSQEMWGKADLNDLVTAANSALDNSDASSISSPNTGNVGLPQESPSKINNPSSDTQITSPRSSRPNNIGTPPKNDNNIISNNGGSFNSRNFAPTFYNKSAKVLADYKGDKIAAGSVVQYLKGKGVKDEEIKWLGIQAFTEGKKSISKQELIDFINANSLNIEQHTLNNESNMEYYNSETGEMMTLEEAQEFAERTAGGFGVYPYEVRQDEDDDGVFWYVDGETAYEKGLIDVDDNTVSSLKNGSLDWSIYDSEFFRVNKYEDRNSTKWEDYTTEGAENYREYKFKMPNSYYQNDAMRVHWNDAGVLLHARVGDFYTAVDGKFGKVLFIDEIQSDWHNAGASIGYANGETAALIDEYSSLSEKYDSRSEARKDEIWKKLNPKHARQQELNDKIVDYTIENNTDDIIQWCLDKGFAKDKIDAVHILKGETILDDFLNADEGLDLEDEKVYEEWKKGTRTARAFDAMSEEQKQIVTGYRELYRELMLAEQDANDEKDIISEVVYSGKELPPDAPFKNGAYTDYALKVLLREAAENNYDYLAWTTGKMQEGRWSSEFAEGYRIEYDQDIPKFLNKFGKQFGAKVSSVDIFTDNAFNETLNVPAIKITDSMKESVLYNGQPMFSRNLTVGEELRKQNAAINTAISTSSNVKIKKDTAANIATKYNVREDVASKALSEITDFAKSDYYTPTEAKHIATQIAQGIIYQQTLASNPKYKALIDVVDNRKITISQQSTRNIENFELFKNMNPDLNITDNGIPVGQVYAELQQKIGEAYFPKDIKAQYKQLQQIAKVVSDFNNTFLSGSLDNDMAIEYIANDILGSLTETEIELGNLQSVMKNASEDNLAAFMDLRDAYENATGESEEEDSDTFERRRSNNMQPTGWSTTRVEPDTSDETPIDKIIKRWKDDKPESLSSIVAQFEQRLGLNVTEGYMRGSKALGLFMKDNRGIRIRLANDLPSVSHEVGHWIDEKYNMSGMDSKTTAKITASAKKELLDNMSDTVKGYPKSHQLAEAIGEYSEMYFRNSAEAASRYPEFTKYFLESLDKRDLAVVKDLADKCNKYFSSETATAAIRYKHEGADDFRTLGEKADDAYLSMKVKWVDTNEPIKRYSQLTNSDAYTKATNVAYANNRASEMIENGIWSADGTHYICGGLKAALADINKNVNSIEYREFAEYLVCKHGPEFLESAGNVFANPKFNNDVWMNNRVAELDAKYGEKFAKAADSIYEFEKAVTQEYLVNTGIIPQQMADEWNRRWKYYVPFNRVMDWKKSGARRSTKQSAVNRSNPVKSAFGSTRDLIHAVDNIIYNTTDYIMQGLLNQVGQSIVTAAEQFGVDANIMEDVTDQYVRQNETRRDNIKAVVSGEDFSETQGVEGAELSTHVGSELIRQYGSGSVKNSTDRVIRVLFDGEPKYYKVNDVDLYTAITNLSPNEAGSVARFFSMTSRMITSATTGWNVIWSVTRNSLRDLGTFAFYTKDNNPYSVASKIAKTYWEEIKVAANGTNLGSGLRVADLHREYLAMGGGHTGEYSTNMKMAKETTQRLQKRGVVQNIAHAFNPCNFVTFISDTIEMGPREATYMYYRENGASPQEAFYQAMEVTTNFRRGGYKAKNWNKMIPYLNANIQGTYKFAKFFAATDVPKEERAKTRAKRFARAAIISSAAALSTIALNYHDDDKKKEYERISAYKKNNFLLYPTKTAGKYLAIPKPRELGTMTSLYERIFEYTYGENKAAFDDFVSYVNDNTLPAISADIASMAVGEKDLFEAAYSIVGEMGIIGVIANLGSNKDFLGRDIVPQYMMDSLNKEDQWDSQTSMMAYFIGQQSGLSPMQIDYFMEQCGAFIWKPLEAAFPKDKYYRDTSLGIKNSLITDNLYSNDDTNWVYNNANQLKKDWNGEELHAEEEGRESNFDYKLKYDFAETVKGIYSNFRNLTKTEKESDELRKVRSDFLSVIENYKAYDGEWSDEIKQIVALANEQRDASILPNALDTTVKETIYTGEGDNRKVRTEYHELSPQDYYDYQNYYLGQYYDLVNEAIDGKSGEEALIAAKKAEQLAKDNALNFILEKNGLGIKEDKYHIGEDGYITDIEYIDYKTRQDVKKEELGKDNVNQNDVMDIIYDMGLDRKTSYNLFHSEYESDTNNPWASQYSKFDIKDAITAIKARKDATSTFSYVADPDELASTIAGLGLSRSKSYELYKAMDGEDSRNPWSETFSGMNTREVMKIFSEVNSSNESSNTVAGKVVAVEAVFKTSLSPADKYTILKEKYNVADEANPWSENYKNIDIRVAMDYIKQRAEKYKEIDKYNDNRPAGTDKRSFNQEDMISIISNMNVDNHTKYMLFHSKYSSDKNNPWKRYK